METELLKLPIDRLIIDKANVRKRKAADGSDDSLKASILAHGLLMPIAVRPPEKNDADILGERYRVIAGGRRLTAIGALIEEGKIRPDYLINCAVREDLGDAEAEEASLAENIQRVAMSPVEEVRAFRDLVQAGSNPSEIAFRFGLPERRVRQRLALADLHPKVLEALDAGTISIELAQAYTTGSQEKQLEVLESKSWDSQHAMHVRRMMTAGHLAGGAPLARRITEERYKAAGGEVFGDLFGESTWWISADIVAKLKAEIIAEMAAAATADGWAWCDTVENVGFHYYQLDRVFAKPIDRRTAEQVARMEELEKLIEAYEGDDAEDEDYAKLEAEYSELESLARGQDFTAEQKAGAGVLIDDELYATSGVIRPGEINPDKPDASPRGSKPEKADKDPLAPSAAMQERLSQSLTNAIREAMIKDNHVSLAYVVAMMHSDVNQYSGYRPGHISHNGHSYDTRSFENRRGFSEIFEELLGLDDAALLDKVAELASAAVNVGDGFFDHQQQVPPDRRLSMRAALVKATKADPVAHFNARDFFQGSSKTVIEAAMAEMEEPLAPGKKESLVNQAESFAERRGWLPQFLRFDGYALKPKPQIPNGKAVTKAEHDAKTAVDVTKGTGKATAKDAAKPKGAKAIKVDEDIIAILADNCTVEGNKLLIGSQITRDKYQALNKVLVALGGKWTKHVSAHVFDEDPSNMIEEVIQTGQYSRTKQDFGQFDTPPDVVEDMINWAEIEPGMSVLEPSAGIGNIVLGLVEAGAWVTAVEIDEKRADALVKRIDDSDAPESTEAVICEDDFMNWDNGEIFDRVLMNPPFAGQVDIDHVRRAYEQFLKPGGVMVSIMSNSIQFRQNKKATDFRTFLNEVGAEIEELVDGAFASSGTMVKTVMVKIRRQE